MELFEVEQERAGSAAGTRGPAPSPTIVFDTSPEFGLFFQEDGSKSGFSDPPSVEGSVDGSPSPGGSVGSLSGPGSALSSACPSVQPSGISVAAEPTGSPSGQQQPQPQPSPGQINGQPFSPQLKQEQQFAAADSNSTTPTKSFVPCKVCGDKASGYHYGVTSCEGCKGFFRRSIQKQIEYRCLRDGKCLVIRLNRNRCQYCRFKKCLAVGMSRDSVRYGRVPKRSRERSGEERVSTSDSSATPPDPETCPAYELILSVAQAHVSNCDYTEEALRSIVRKPIPSPPPPSTNGPEVASSTVENLESQRIWLWQQFAAHVTPSVQRVVEFAKRVPGFCELSQDDQLILIKIGFFELWLSHVSRLTTDSTFTFADGTFITRQQLELIYDTDFVASLFHFTSSFNSLLLGDTELGLFSGLVLLSSDRPGVTDIKAVEHHRDKLIEALKLQMSRSGGGVDAGSILAKLPELKALGAKHALMLDWFRLNWDKLRLPPLFAEIFDIPKCEEDLQ